MGRSAAEREKNVCLCVCALVRVCYRGQEADWSGGGALCQTSVQGGMMVNWSTVRSECD